MKKTFKNLQQTIRKNTRHSKRSALNDKLDVDILKLMKSHRFAVRAEERGASVLLSEEVLIKRVKLHTC